MTPRSTPHNKIRVQAIKNGTVIDHIPAGYGLTIIKLLGGIPIHKVITLGFNLRSKALTHKDIIKIEDRELTEKEVGQIALIALNATINIVRGYRVVKKIKPRLPEILTGAVPCPNPNCITNHEKMPTVFYTRTEKKHISLSCRYCEKQFSQAEIVRYI